MLLIKGEQFKPFIDPLARLRIEMLKSFPYLYEGSMDVERERFSHYANHPQSIMIAEINSSGELDAALRGIPLLSESESFSQPLKDYNPETIFYIGELIIRPHLRNQGLGKFMLQEYFSAVKGIGYSRICGFTVIQSNNHPARPENYFDHEQTWIKSGLRPLQNVIAKVAWKTSTADTPVEHSMQAWIKED